MAGSLGSLVPTLGFIPMLYANSTPFNGFVSFTQRMQGPSPSLHSGNCEYTLLISHRLSIDTTSFTGSTRGGSANALTIDKVSRTKREATLILSKEHSDADSVSSKIASTPCPSAGFYRVIPFVGSRLGAGRPPAHRTYVLDGLSRLLRIHRICLLLRPDASSA